MKRSGPVRLPFEFFVFAFAIIGLLLAPQTAFAQHGGGGHGGGGHFGGGGGHFGGFGGGGGHSGGGTPVSGYTGGHSHASSHVSAPPHASSDPTANAARRPAGSSLPLGWGAGLNRPVATGAGLPAGQAGKGIAEFSAAPSHVTIGFPPVSGGATTFPSAPLRSGPLSFSGQGHEIWQDSGTRAPLSASTTPREPGVISMRPQPPHIIRPVPPGFFPGVFAPSFGFFGFSPFLGFGWGLGCDPFDPWGFGCGGFGYGYGYGPGYGYGYGGYYPPAWDYSAPPAPSDNSNETSSEYGPFSWQNPPSNSTAQSEVPAPNSVIYLQDGSNYEVSDYWVADNKLHYVTNYGGENAVDLNQVDIQRTVDANASRGLNFSLHPVEPKTLTPPPSTDNAPPSADNAPAAAPAPHAPAAPPSPDAPPAPPQP